MSVIVNISNEDPAFELLKNLKAQLPADSIKDTWLVGFKVAKVEKVLKVLIDNIQILLLGTEIDIQGRFTLIAYILNQRANHELSRSLIYTLSTASESRKAALQALALLYDTIHEGILKFEIFKSIITQAKIADLLGMVVPHLQKIDQFVKHWQDVTSQDKQILFWEISQMPINQSLKAKFIKLYFAESSELPHDHFEDAISQLISFSGASEIGSILQLSCMHRIYGHFAELIHILQEVSVPKYIQFKDHHVEYLATKGFDTEKCLDTIRVLALCKLAKQHEEFTYAQAALELEVNEDEIDDWVVKSVTYNLLDAKIDEVEKKIKAKKNTSDQNEKYWENTSILLESWEKNLS